MISPLLVMAALVGGGLPPHVEETKPIRILFLGDDGHHLPAARFRDLQPVMAQRGIELTYTESAGDLNARTLAGYDGLMIYANTTRITPEQEKALLDYVEQGQRLHSAALRFVLLPEFAKICRPGWRSILEARDWHRPD